MSGGIREIASAGRRDEAGGARRQLVERLKLRRAMTGEGHLDVEIDRLLPGGGLRCKPVSTRCMPGLRKSAGGCPLSTRSRPVVVMSSNAAATATLPRGAGRAARSGNASTRPCSRWPSRDRIDRRCAASRSGGNAASAVEPPRRRRRPRACARAIGTAPRTMRNRPDGDRATRQPIVRSRYRPSSRSSSGCHSGEVTPGSQRRSQLVDGAKQMHAHGGFPHARHHADIARRVIGEVTQDEYLALAIGQAIQRAHHRVRQARPTARCSGDALRRVAGSIGKRLERDPAAAGALSGRAADRRRRSPGCV